MAAWDADEQELEQELEQEESTTQESQANLAAWGADADKAEEGTAQGSRALLSGVWQPSYPSCLGEPS